MNGFDPESFDMLLAQASPEELEQMLGAGTLDERAALLQQQMAQAEGLRTNNAASARSPIGAALHGVGDMLNAYSARQGVQQARAGHEAVLGQKDALRRAYVEMLRRGGRSAPSPMGAGDVPLPPGLG